LHKNAFISFEGTREEGWIPARFTALNCLTFPEGSTVSINRNGMLVLRSSNPGIDTIFIPSVLDMPLGVATKDYFAGSDYFDPGLVPANQHLTPAAFYHQFIEAFIAQIKAHATSVKAG